MKLNEICEVYSGYALKAFNDAEDGLPVVKIGNILTDGTLNLQECQYTTDSVNEKYYSQRGDIYIALSGATTGKIGIMDTGEKYVINQRVGIVRQKSDDVPQEYIKYFLLRLTDRILQEAAGCAQPNISPKQIAEYVIPDTSQEKMQEICEVLDRTKKIIDSRKAEISALDDLIKARFVEMFYNKGYSVLGWNDVFNTTTGKLDSNAATEDGEYPFFTCSKEMLRINKFAFDQEALLLAGNNAAGKYDVKYYNGKFNAYQRTYVLGLKEDWSYQLFRYQLEDKLTYLQQQSLGGLTKYLTMKILGELDFIIPPIDKQIEFEKFVHQVDKSKVVYMCIHKKLGKQKKQIKYKIA